jgi:hypothetical protein
MLDATMFAPTIQRKASWLAFAAMALLMVMPTSGRLLAAFSAGICGQDVQHAGMIDAVPAAMSSHGAMAPDHGAANDMHHHGGTLPHGDGICPYCPLLGTMNIPLPHPAPVRPVMPGPMVATRVAAVAPAPLLYPGLGPRGPPLSLKA